MVLWWLSFSFFIFTLLVGPEISEPPTNRTKEEKQTFDFSCIVTGYPTPDVVWTKNGLELNVTGDVRLSVSSNDGDHQLNISNVQQSDAGQYRCVANNSLDTATSSSATLTVQCECQSSVYLYICNVLVLITFFIRVSSSVDHKFYRSLLLTKPLFSVDVLLVLKMAKDQVELMRSQWCYKFLNGLNTCVRHCRELRPNCSRHLSFSLSNLRFVVFD